MDSRLVFDCLTRDQINPAGEDPFQLLLHDHRLAQRVDDVRFDHDVHVALLVELVRQDGPKKVELTDPVPSAEIP
jgi:hypothetical protein